MLGKLWKAIKAIFKKIFNFIKEFVKKFGVVILAVVAIWFAPAIATWLASSGAPGWLASAFSWIGTNLTPTLTSVGSWLSKGAASLWGGVKNGWAALSMSQKVALVVGAATMLAPEETAAFVEEAINTVSDTVTSVVGGVASGFASSSLGMLAIGGFLLWVLMSSDEDKQGA